jgi:hypothetical protein
MSQRFLNMPFPKLSFLTRFKEFQCWANVLALKFRTLLKRPFNRTFEISMHNQGL